MNNWRLLLLALVAVAQPIASFTERNFIDGRQQCCDRKSQSLSEDSRASVYRTTFTKPTSAEYRLNQRDDIREDHRHRLKHYNIAFRRAATESSSLRNRETESLRDARSTRHELSFEVPTEEYNHEHNQPSHDRARTYRATKDINFNEGDRRVVKKYLESQNDKIAVSSQFTRNRLHSRTNHVYERLREAPLESRRVTRRIQTRFQELIRVEPSRETRHIIRRINLRHGANLREGTSGASMIRQQVANELMNALQGERSIRTEIRPTFEINNERQVSGQRLSVRTIAEAPDKRIRFNAREKKSGNVISNTLILSAQHQQRVNMGAFRDKTNSFQRSQKTNIQKVASFARGDNAYVRFEQNNENRRALRDVTRSFRENQNERINLNFRENPNDEGFREGRSTNRMENNSRRKIRTTMIFREDRKHIRDQETRFITNIERRREVMTERIKDIRSDDRHFRERNSESRTESRETERINGNRKYTIKNEIRFRDLTTENRQNIRKDEKYFSNRNSEMRREPDVNKKQVTENEINNMRLVQREEKVKENQRDIRKNVRFSRDRNSDERRKELRSVAIKNESRREARSEERRFSDRPDSITGSRRQILDDTRHSIVRDRRDFRSTERTRKEQENQNTENNFREDHKNSFRESQTFVISENQRKMKSIYERKSTSKYNIDSKNKALERYNVERRGRSLVTRNVHESETQFSRFDNSRDVSRIQIKSLNNDKRMEREIIDRNIEYAVNRMNMISTYQKEEDTVNDTVFTNWQYFFYTMQGIYLCSLIIKAVTPNVTSKAKSGNWWSLRYPGPVKVD